MPSPSSTSQAIQVADSAGDTAAISLLSGGGNLSGMSSIGAVTNTLAAFLVTPGEVTIETESGSGNTANAIAQAGSSGFTSLTVTTFLQLMGELSVEPQQVMASTSPSGATVTASNNVGFVSTVTPDPSAGGSTAFVEQCSNNGAVFYGVGVIRDAQTADQQAVAVQCVVPIPASTPGVNLVTCHVEILIILKCTVGSGLGPLAAGAYYIQKGYTDWVNAAGTVSPANISLTAQGTPGFVTNPIYSVTEERGTVVNISGDYYYSIGPAHGLVVAATNSIVISVLPSASAIFGTTVGEIFATVTYN